MQNNAPISDENNIAREFKEFAYIVSHDLSAPLRAMIEFSRMLKKEQTETLNEDGKQYLSLIIENGEKKKRIHEHNKRHEMIFRHAELLRENVNIGAPVHEAKPGDRTGTGKKDVKLWGAAVRNRLDNSRRKTEDRWNRFAGTSGGGGMGR